LRELGVLTLLAVFLGIERGGGNGQQEGRLYGFGEAGVGGWIAAFAFEFDGVDFLFFFDAGGFVFGAEAATSVVAFSLRGRSLAAEAAEYVDDL